MKNTVILLLLMIMSPVLGKDLHQVYTYKNIPEWIEPDVDVMQAVIILASWASNYITYTFHTILYDDTLVFISHNDDCVFVFRFNTYTRDCEIEFSAKDTTFDYANFKTVTDFYFLDN